MDVVRAVQRDEGQALVEYALMLLLIAIVSVGVLTALGGRVSSFIHASANLF